MKYYLQNDLSEVTELNQLSLQIFNEHVAQELQGIPFQHSQQI